MHAPSPSSDLAVGISSISLKIYCKIKTKDFYVLFFTV